MISFKHKGSFKNTERFFNNIKTQKYMSALEQWGQLGVDTLAANTPKRTGLTAASWAYKIERNDSTTTLSWYNTNVNDGVNIAIILQYGHGTGTGGYVQGQDYINPAMAPIFDTIAENVWAEIKRA